jgi:hypothetical protein
MLVGGLLVPLLLSSFPYMVEADLRFLVISWKLRLAKNS